MSTIFCTVNLYVDMSCHFGSTYNCECMAHKSLISTRCTHSTDHHSNGIALSKCMSIFILRLCRKCMKCECSIQKYVFGWKYQKWLERRRYMCIVGVPSHFSPTHNISNLHYEKCENAIITITPISTSDNSLQEIHKKNRIK